MSISRPFTSFTEVCFHSQGRKISQASTAEAACVTKYDSIGKVPCQVFRGFTLQSEIRHGAEYNFFCLVYLS